MLAAVEECHGQLPFLHRTVLGGRVAAAASRIRAVAVPSDTAGAAIAEESRPLIQIIHR